MEQTREANGAIRALAMGLAALLCGCQLLDGGPKGGPGLEPPGEDVPGNLAGPASGAAGSAGMPVISEPDEDRGGEPASPPAIDPDPSNDFGNAGTGATAGAGGAAPAAGGAAPTPNEPMAGGDTSPPPAAFTPNNCGMETYPAERATDLYLVLDESLAMVDPADLWTPLYDALGDWLRSSGTAGMEVALLGYQAACDAAEYATPSVSWGALPGHADALLGAMQSPEHGAGGATVQALTGAIQQAQLHSAMVDRPAAVVLLAAGAPAACGATPFATALVAASGALSTPPVPTRVLALGASGADYDVVASGGGSGQAILVDDPTSADAVRQGLTTLLGEASCVFGLPESATGFDPSLVNVWIDDASGSRLVPYAADGCSDGEGWVFGTLASTPSVELCPASCRSLAEGDGTVHVEVGCERQ